MPETIISDTSILILFDKINELQILNKVYTKVYITQEVADEYGEELPSWVKVKSVKNKIKQTEIENLVDLGEASVIALALEFEDALLLIDDKKGRKLAKNLNIKLSGTLGTILKAKHFEIIDRIKPLIKKLININYRISNELVRKVLKKADEE